MGGKRGGIRLGSYYPVESPVHGLDPRAKLLGMLAFLTGIFGVKEFWAFGLVYVFGFGALWLAKIPPTKALAAVRGLIFLLALTCAINMLVTPGEQVLWQWEFLTLTVEGIERGLLMLLRLVALICFSGLLTFTTTPIELADGMESLLSPFKRWGVPAHEFAMMMTIALRFVPILLAESDKLMKAQRSRGGDVASGSVMKRAKTLVAMVVPLLFNALKRADDLAIAMEARAYTGGEGRVSLRELKWTGRDTLALAVVLGFTAFMVISSWL